MHRTRSSWPLTVLLGVVVAEDLSLHPVDFVTDLKFSLSSSMTHSTYGDMPSHSGAQSTAMQFSLPRARLNKKEGKLNLLVNKSDLSLTNVVLSFLVDIFIGNVQLLKGCKMEICSIYRVCGSCP